MMEFDALTDAYNDDRLENGAWMQFTGPDGEPWFLTVADKKYPVRAKVRSMLSEKYDAHMDRMMEGAASRGRRLKGEHARSVALRREMKDNQPKSFAALVAEMENISKAKLGRVTPPESDLLHFAKLPKCKDWVEQALEFAADKTNFGVSSGSEEGPGKDESAAD